jgi:hypothetical protein
MMRDVKILLAAADDNGDGELGHDEAHRHHSSVVEFHSHNRHSGELKHDSNARPILWQLHGGL